MINAMSAHTGGISEKGGESMNRTTQKRAGLTFPADRARLKRKARSGILIAVRTLLIICICFVILFPMISKVQIAFTSEQDLYDATVKYVPKHFTLGNFRSALEGLHYLPALLNSFLFSSLIGVLTLLSSSMVGYGFARFEFPLKRMWFALVLLVLLIPPQTIMVPLYIQFRYYTFGGLLSLFGHSVNLTTTIVPMLLMNTFCIGMKNGLYIYLMRQSFRSVPKELEEAAYIDGAGVLQTFRQVVLPSVRPMMISIFLFSFVWHWTDIQYATMFVPNGFDILSLKLMNLSNAKYSVYWLSGGTMSGVTPGFESLLNNAGSVLVMLPLFLVYILCQRYFIEGIERSGITG